MNPCPLSFLNERCESLHESALELSMLLQGMADLQGANPLFWSLARQSQRLTEALDTLQVHVKGTCPRTASPLWATCAPLTLASCPHGAAGGGQVPCPFTCPQKAETPSEAAAGSPVHNPIKRESNHEVHEV